ncbi:MAG: HAMP domain-containing histidine kinase, partial [Pirellulales bacterium]|nr:HAMP domain-containing histidine kinase [Pirellulales bacterium]
GRVRIPIRYQFMLPLLAVAIASLLAVGIIHSHLVTQQTKARIEKRLHGVISVLSESSYPLTNSVLRQMGGLANAEFILTDKDGRRIAPGSSLKSTRLAADSFTASKVEQVSLDSTIVVDSRPYLHSSVWIERRPNIAKPAVLHILFAQDDFDAAWRASFLPPVFVGGMTIVAVTLVVHLVTRRVSKVLSNLGQEVERLAEGDFSEVLQPRLDDETKDLAVAVNRTAEQLAEYEREIRRTEQMQTVAMLGAGLAHEMRNAATGCRMAVDLHAESCQAGSEDDSLGVAKRQLLLMENRLQRFLQIGKENVTPNDQDLDFSKLVGELVSLVWPAARHAGVQLEWRQPEDSITVHADSELLGQAVMNLLLNALDAAAKSQTVANRTGAVCVELHNKADVSELIVSDSGNGPEAAVAGAVFEPFVTEKAEGIGLGLAVARRVVESYGGRISWNRVEGFTQFKICLPLAVAGAGHV